MFKKFIASLTISGVFLTMIAPIIPAYAYYSNDSSKYLGETIDSNGKYQGWYQFPDGGWGYFIDYGKLVKNVWINEADGSYGIGEDGRMVTGWFPNASDNKWYFFRSDGKVQKGWLESDNLWYYFDDEGAMLTDWQYINNKWYYFDKETGVMACNTKIGDSTLSADGSLKQ